MATIKKLMGYFRRRWDLIHSLNSFSLHWWQKQCFSWKIACRWCCSLHCSLCRCPFIASRVSPQLRLQLRGCRAIPTLCRAHDWTHRLLSDTKRQKLILTKARKWAFAFAASLGNHFMYFLWRKREREVVPCSFGEMYFGASCLQPFTERALQQRGADPAVLGTRNPPVPAASTGWAPAAPRSSRERGAGARLGADWSRSLGALCDLRGAVSDGCGGPGGPTRWRCRPGRAQPPSAPRPRGERTAGQLRAAPRYRLHGPAWPPVFLPLLPRGSHRSCPANSHCFLRGVTSPGVSPGSLSFAPWQYGNSWCSFRNACEIQILQISGSV